MQRTVALVHAGEDRPIVRLEAIEAILEQRVQRERPVAEQLVFGLRAEETKALGFEIEHGDRLLILVAYALLSTGKLDGRSRAYQLMNVAGAIGFIINSGWNGAIPSAALSVVWLAIGLYATGRAPRERRSDSRPSPAGSGD